MRQLPLPTLLLQQLLQHLYYLQSLHQAQIQALCLPQAVRTHRQHRPLQVPGLNKHRFQNPTIKTKPFRSFHLRHHSTASSSESTQPKATLQGQSQGPQYRHFTIRTSRIPEKIFQIRCFGKKIRGQGQKNVFS
jgi:hypothetical protein